MASIVHKIKSVPAHLPVGTAHRRGVMGMLVDKGERYGAIAAYGFAKGFYADKFVGPLGQGYDLWSGLGFQALGVVLNIASAGRSKAACHLERLGDAGIMSWIDTVATKWGHDKAGRQVVSVSPGKNVARLPGQSVVGMISPAATGPFLSADDIARFANRR